MRIAALCEQLGYLATPQEVEQRLNVMHQDGSHAVYVAQASDGYVVGWVHVCICQLVVADMQAEIWGLVVDADYRECGIGRLLMQHAEQWAQKEGCCSMSLRSNIIRKEAHAFYERIGYTILKTSLIFHKML